MRPSSSPYIGENNSIMKHLFSPLFFILAVSLIGTGCASSNQGLSSSNVIDRNVELDPIRADINVNDEERLKGSSQSIYFLFFRLKGDNKYADGISYSANAFNKEGLFSFLNPFRLFEMIATGDAEGKVKSAAAYNAIEGKEVDVLVHPTYSVTKKNYLIVSVYEAEVQGYGATYSNFRTEPPLDQELNRIIAAKTQFRVEE